MIRVVVADDSPTARGLLVGIMRAEADLEVVAEARDGLEAIRLTQQLRPDVVTMDLDMPRMDGYTATKEIMITAPTPIVIVSGSVERREVETAMHALRAGALAVVHKPAGPASPAFEEMACKLVATVRAMAGVRVVRHWRAAPTGEKGAAVVRAPRECVVVAVAASTGGPAALQRILSGLPGDFPVPILVVQHITPGFTAGLAEWLNSVCDLQVRVASHGERLQPHTVYLAPDDRHLGVTGQSVLVSSAAPIGGFRPSATFLFDSTARAFGPRATAVILTGMGNDGVEGLKAVRQTGGRIIVENEQSCVVFGMPAAAIAAGLADEVLPLDGIAARLVPLGN